MAGAMALAANATAAATVSGGSTTFVSAVLPWAAALVALALAWEQLSYLRKKGTLPGPALVIPLLGSAVPMILDPANYWRRLGAAASAPTTSSAASSSSCAPPTSPTPSRSSATPSAAGRKLFGEHNLIYMFGDLDGFS